jgi:hypothetical protein
MRQSVYKCTCNITAKDGYLRTVQYGFCGGISVEDLAHDKKRRLFLGLYSIIVHTYIAVCALNGF